MISFKTKRMPFHFTIPIPIFVLVEFFQALSSLFSIFPFIVKLVKKPLQKFGLAQMKPKELVSFGGSLCQELQGQGPFTLLEVYDGQSTRFKIHLL